MSAEAAPMRIVTSPHLRASLSTGTIMRHVVYALIPVVAVSFFVFGLSALLLVLVTTAACIITEYVICRISGRDNSLGDASAIITGSMLALTLPPGFPLWMGAAGGVVSILLGKAIFGGLGQNIFNPALVGRAFLQASFPVAITTWTPACVTGRFTECIPSTLAWPFLSPAPVADYIQKAAVDGFSGATTLSILKFGDPGTPLPKLFDMFSGLIAGSAGETSALIILLCGLYLAVRKMLDWRIPVGVLASAFLSTLLFNLLSSKTPICPVVMLCSGGLAFGAVFMATDMVTSPVTSAGVWIYSFFIGFMTILIRLKGGLPEGVMYAILMGNAIVPLLDRATQPRVYGVQRKAPWK